MNVEKIKEQLEKARLMTATARVLIDLTIDELSEHIDLGETYIKYCDTLEEAINTYVITGQCKLEDIMKEIEEQLEQLEK